MSRVVLCYLETPARAAMGSLGRGQFHLLYSMNAIIFLQSFLEAFVVRVLFCYRVDPCTESGVRALMMWSTEMLVMPSTCICKPRNMMNIQTCYCVIASNGCMKPNLSGKSTGDINQMLSVFYCVLLSSILLYFPWPAGLSAEHCDSPHSSLVIMS